MDDKQSELQLIKCSLRNCVIRSIKKLEISLGETNRGYDWEILLDFQILNFEFLSIVCQTKAT